MDLNVISQLISSVGFPIFVAVWMLYKSSEESKQTTAAINELKLAIQALTDEVKHHSGEDE